MINCYLDFLGAFYVNKGIRVNSATDILKMSLLQILSSRSISSSPIFRHFYQVNFSHHNIVNRKGRGWSRYQVQWSAKDSYADEDLEEVVVVEQHGSQIG